MEMIVDEQDLASIDLDKLEEAYINQELQSLPLEKLCKVHKVYMDSTVGATSRSGGGLGIHSDPHKDHRKAPKESKRRGGKWHNNSFVRLEAT
jgi:hypothetical protein